MRLPPALLVAQRRVVEHDPEVVPPKPGGPHEVVGVWPDGPDPERTPDPPPQRPQVDLFPAALALRSARGLDQVAYESRLEVRVG